MSLAQQLLRDYRPLLRMLDADPTSYHPPHRSLFDERFLHASDIARPVVDVSDEGENYVVDVELPGVKRENVDVKVGNGGRSITIEGKVISRRAQRQALEDAETPSESTTERPNPSRLTSNQISSESVFSDSSTFTRTIWLPLRVDGTKVSATLADGILTLTIPKLTDNSSVSVAVN